MKKDVIKKIKRIVGLVVACMMLFSVNIAAAQNSSDLDVETKNEIREDYLEFYKLENPDSSSAQAMTIDDIVIRKYYGVYNGYDIVQIYFKDQQMRFDEYIHRIGEYQFITNSSLAPYFYAYKDGTFTHVKDAYASGMLTDKDIYLIAKSEEEHIASWKDPFADVARDDWYHKSVEYAYAYNLFAGLTETAFGPNEEMTRAMLATVLWRYAGSPDGGQNVFIDVPEDTWYTDAVAWAAEQGLVYGISDGIFAPEEKITREQLAAIFYRYAKKVNAKELEADGLAGQYADEEEVSPWAYESVSWANGREILSGRNIDGVIYIAPAGNATRAEVASMIMRFIQYLE